MVCSLQSLKFSAIYLKNWSHDNCFLKTNSHWNINFIYLISCNIFSWFSQKGLLKIFTLNWFLNLHCTLISGIYSIGLTDLVQPVHPLRINVEEELGVPSVKYSLIQLHYCILQCSVMYYYRVNMYYILA